MRNGAFVAPDLAPSSTFIQHRFIQNNSDPLTQSDLLYTLDGSDLIHGISRVHSVLLLWSSLSLRLPFLLGSLIHEDCPSVSAFRHPLSRIFAGSN